MILCFIKIERYWIYRKVRKRVVRSKGVVSKENIIIGERVRSIKRVEWV